MYFSLGNEFHDIHNVVRWVVEVSYSGVKNQLGFIETINGVKDISVFLS